MTVMTSSQAGIRVLRQMPSNADNPVQAWLLRGGFLFQHAAGIYCFSPLMKRVEKKVSDIIATEITKEGGAEMRLPILQSADVWKQTGRWDVYQHERLMFQLQDRKDREFGLSPTAEEVCCEFAKNIVVSASQLPLNIFQQNFKFRDELRPRSGLLRSREFIMMDAYSFDLDEAGLDLSYEAMKRAYHAIFKALGMDYIVVQADSGAIGGSASEEFMSVSAHGEDTLLYNDGYAANVERAQSEPMLGVKLETGELEYVDTGDAATIEEVATCLETHSSAIIKSLVYDINYHDRTEQLLVLMRGDCEVNEIKLQNHMKALSVVPSSPETVLDVTGVKPGFVGPINLKTDISTLADQSLQDHDSYIAGCCKPNQHVKYIKPGRDFVKPDYVDLRQSKAGETAPNGQLLQECRGIEVGHIFKLGDKYSKALKAGVTDSNQTFQNFQMGCYGIGTTRVIAAVIDQNCNEDKGIIWPMNIAPFHVHIMALKADLADQAKELAQALSQQGVECLLEDRKGSAGSLFNDSDVLGLPLRIVLGRDYDKGQVEFLNRRTAEKTLVDNDKIIDQVLGLVKGS